jgi:hypothetical protein
MLGKKFWFGHKAKKFKNKFKEKLGKKSEELKKKPQKRRIFNLTWSKIVKFSAKWTFNMFPVN